MNDSKKLINPKITPEIQAMIDSDDPGCGKVYTTNLCIMRHRAAKIKESKGLEHGPCAYCPLILRHLAETKQNKKENAKMETKKANEKPLKPGKPGTLSVCVECRESRKIATSGVCWSCYAKPEVKKKYGIGQCLKRTTENTSEAPKAKQPKAIVAPPGAVELVVDGKSLPAADTIHAKTHKAQSGLLAECIERAPKERSVKAFLSDKKADLENMKRQVREQENLLNLKHFEINNLERFIQDLEYAMGA